MLDALKKKLAGVTPEVDMQSAEDAKTSVEMAMATQLQDALAQIETLTASLSEKDSVIAEMSSKLESLAGFAAEQEKAAEALRAEAEAKALAAKREKLADVIGKDNPNLEATFAAVSALDEASFEVVVKGFAASYKQEESTEMFREVGVSGEAKPDASDKPTESAEMRIIKKMKK